MTGLYDIRLVEFLSWDSCLWLYFCSWGVIRFRPVWGGATHATLPWLISWPEPLVSFSGIWLREKLHLVCQNIWIECLEHCVMTILSPARNNNYRCLEIISNHSCLLLKETLHSNCLTQAHNFIFFKAASQQKLWYFLLCSKISKHEAVLWRFHSTEVKVFWISGRKW